MAEPKAAPEDILRAVRQVLYNEVFPKAKIEAALDDGTIAEAYGQTWREWIRAQMLEMLQRHLKGHDMMNDNALPSMVQHRLDAQIRQAVQRHSWLSTKESFEAHIKKVAQAEATKIAEQMIRESFTLDLTLSGSVHQTARTARAVNLAGDDTP